VSVGRATPSESGSLWNEVYGIEQIDSVNFISTEFIDGETVRQRVRKAPMNRRCRVSVLTSCRNDSEKSF